jgi:hypothetical protein
VAAIAAAGSCGRDANSDAHFGDGDPDGVVRTFAAALMFWRLPCGKLMSAIARFWS